MRYFLVLALGLAGASAQSSGPSPTDSALPAGTPSVVGQQGSTPAAGGAGTGATPPNAPGPAPPAGPGPAGPAPRPATAPAPVTVNFVPGPNGEDVAVVRGPNGLTPVNLDVGPNGNPVVMGPAGPTPVSRINGPNGQINIPAAAPGTAQGTTGAGSNQGAGPSQGAGANQSAGSSQAGNNAGQGANAGGANAGQGASTGANAGNANANATPPGPENRGYYASAAESLRVGSLTLAACAVVALLF